MTLEKLEFSQSLFTWLGVVFGCLALICGAGAGIFSNKISKLSLGGTNSVINKTAISHNQSGGITANEVTVSKIQRTLQQNEKDFFLNDFKDKNEGVRIFVMANDPEAYKFAQEILNFFNSNGYNNITGIDVLTIAGEPYTGIHVFRDKKPTMFIVGHGEQ